MEYIKDGSLANVLKKQKQQDEQGFKQKEPEFTHEQVLRIATDIAKGLKCLHELTPRIIHRDLKCENVLVGKVQKLSFSGNNILQVYRKEQQYRAKITDFGTAKFLNTSSQADSVVGTLGFYAPEVLNEQRYDEKVDIYAYV